MNSVMSRMGAALRSSFAPGPISEHVLATYGSLRKGLCVFAFLFPFLLVGVGCALDVPIQRSLSAYYFAFPENGPCISFPMRTLFTGVLCAICVSLYLYQGFTALENWLLNAAALSGLGVAFIPKGVDPQLLQACAVLQPIADGEGWRPYLHFGSAGLMFMCLAVVAWKCAGATLSYLPAEHKGKEEGFRRRYKIIAGCMVGVLAVSLALQALDWPYTVLVGEAGGIWVFAWYWFEKTRELALSHAELKAVRDEEPPQAL